MKYIDEIFKEFENRNKGLLIKLRYDSQLLSELLEETSFLNDEHVELSERVFYYKNHLTEKQLCPYCQERKRRFKKLDKGLFPTCGHEECMKAGMSKGAKTKRDWSKIQSKMKETYLKRTGYEHNMQNPEFIEKYKQKFAESHDGALCGCQTKNGIENRIKAQNNKLIERAKKNNIIVTKIENNKIYSYCNKCNHIIEPIDRNVFNRYIRLEWNLCKNCYPEESHSRSNFEEQIYIAIKDFYKKEIICNRKLISNSQYEYDIILPEDKKCIECNGLYYHSEAKVPADYHIKKKEFAEENGYSCIMIWEDEWKDKKDLIISRLKSILNISPIRVFARETFFCEISIKECNEFLKENHLQGESKQGKFAYCLKDKNDQIVQVVLIGKPRNFMKSSNKKIDFELIRMCSKKEYSVIGGFSKIMNNLKRIFDGHTMISFADLSWSNSKLENVYDKVGFKNEGKTVLSYWWFFKSKRHNRIKYSKAYLVKAGFDENLSESKIMHEYFKALKIYGPGNIRYIIDL